MRESFQINDDGEEPASASDFWHWCGFRIDALLPNNVSFLCCAKKAEHYKNMSIHEKKNMEVNAILGGNQQQKLSLFRFVTGAI